MVLKKYDEEIDSLRQAVQCKKNKGTCCKNSEF